MEKIKTLKCRVCNVELTIMENSFFVSEPKKMQKAYCTNCEAEVYEGQTDGWFFVQINEEKKNAMQQCIYPMP
jgi:hypothetical protein